ncbi:hypothetical protein MIM_c29140 [Advenella mimigardefordensis DPN7]|uniref:Uncharacterized protein n=1 Tax=Advenella mimigardefordensis (strain DSM 17166 / LMG 22922 / DPN7) TaxID=1247726 RepID=W0PDM9_ADVMD|nr:hypothetical protein MIM_c29140 [Advenella mimigardefordensis DPN7]
MSSAAQLGDMASNHNEAPATPGIEASPNVPIDSIPAMSQGDAFEPHACQMSHIPHRLPSLFGIIGAVHRSSI